MKLKSIDIDGLESMPKTDAVLMVSPEFYDVLYAINIHMLDGDGHLKKVDKELAGQQWLSLKETFEKIGLKVNVVPGREGLPDMVFSANQSFPLDEKSFLLSQMASKERSPEVGFFQKFYEEKNLETFQFPEEFSLFSFESMGDILWHPRKRFIWCGVGPRTHMECIKYLSENFSIPFCSLTLIRDEFYHLDTCLVLLDEKTAAYIPNAFDEASKSLLKNSFVDLIEIDEREGVLGFAGNAYCPDGKNVIVQKGNLQFNKDVENLGFVIHEVDTSEFIKGGGSVFCLKLPLFKGLSNP